MKKLFVAILALGALASCQKENLPVVEEAKNKTIEINILNLVEETKATQGEGGDTTPGSKKLCAEFGELDVLFVDDKDIIQYQDALVKDNDTMTGDDHDGNANLTEQNYVQDEQYNDDGKRRWHNVPASIKTIAVVRYKKGEDFDKATTLEGKTLTEVQALAADQATNLARPIETMVLCGWDTLEDTGKTHKVEDTVFHVWEAKVNVAPAFARFEVRSINCTNLGDANNKNLPGYTAATYGFDELLLKSLTLTYGGEEYTAPGFGTQRLYGSWDPTAEGYVYKYDQNTNTAASRIEVYEPENGAWSWNLTPDKEFNELVLDIDAYAYDYKINYEEGKQDDRSFPLTVTGLASTKGGAADTSEFDAGNIYYIDLVFTESNIKDAEGICVDVVVTVNAWSVVPVYPVYGNN